MPPNLAHSNPPEPDSAPEYQGHAAIAAQDSFPPFQTFGLHNSWQPAYQWAVECRVLREFLLLLDTCLNYDNSAVFGTLLDEISGTRSFMCLAAWSETEPSAKNLHRLALAVRLKPGILIGYPPLTKALSARAHLNRNLRRDYLVALAIEWVDGIAPEQRDWMQALRTWTLVHAVIRTERGNSQDVNLRELATGLRLACQKDELRRQDMALLKSDFENFDELNRQLAGRARHFSSRIVGDKLAARHTLFNAIVEVAKRHNCADEEFTPTKRPRLLSGMLASGISPATQAAVRETRFLTDDDAPAASTLVTDSDDDDGLVVLVDVAASASYAHQILAAGSVLLLGIEDYQYLPWSWSKPNPYETRYLHGWSQTLRAGAHEVGRMLGALTWLADATGRSLRRVLDFPVARTPGDEWSVDLAMRRLHRLPPRRNPGWLPKADSDRRWLRPVADLIGIDFPADVAATLLALAGRNSAARTMGDLWAWSGDPLAAWREARPAELQRITPGMLGQLLPQRLLEHYGDGVLARMVGSHPDSAMPGACAYASWTRPFTEAALIDEKVPATTTDPEIPIGAGSRLDPIEVLLVKVLGAAASRLEEIRGANDAIAFHNAFTANSVVLLLAATGGRPVDDPFESPMHFDLEIGFVYIEDKGSDTAHGGRLVPLPGVLISFLRDEYPRHLRQLALHLEVSHPQLAESIRALASGREMAGMPYFFLLDGSGPLGWISVSESAIDLLGLFDWSLPLRLFRHRLAIRLRWLATDAELIDAALGHAEAGSATHGDDSFRVWLDDAHQLRQQLEAAFAMLQPKLPATWFSPLQPCQRKMEVSRREKTPSASFGIAHRAEKRQRNRMVAEEQAHREIDEYLAGRQLQDISEDEIHALVKLLILNDKGTPRTTARIRYGVFEGMLDSLWRETGKRVRIKQRFAPFRLTSSVFKPAACGALGLYQQSLRFTRNALDARLISKMNQVELCALGVVTFCVERRVADFRLLGDLAQRRNVRLVSLKGKAFLEHGDALDASDPNACARRFQIDVRLCRIIARFLAVNRESNAWNKAIHPALATLAGSLHDIGRLPSAAPKLSILVRALCEVVDQANVIALPGILAGYLAGRVESYALGWRDWSRMELGEILEFPKTVLADDDGESWEAVRGGVPLGRTGNDDDERSQVEAADFVVALRQILERANADPASANSRDQRRKLSAKLGEAIARFNCRVSTTVLLLGQWLAAIVYRPGKRGTYIAAATLLRYLAALAPRFVGYGHHLDLLAADEDEVTALYAAALEHRDTESTEMVAGRLGDFHHWARDHGVCEPDWSEMPAVIQGRRASPGFFSEAEYRAALQLLLSDKSAPDEERLWRGTLLIYCYRFGLREKEALGLTREDIQDHSGGMRVVLVRDNHLRKLKTPASRRQVPLLFKLSDTERKVLRDSELILEAVTGDVRRHGVLEKVLRERALRLRTVRAVILTLKRVTGNPRIVLHHARHSAPNRLGKDLIGLRNSALAGAMSYKGRRVNDDDIPRSLLGTVGATRRTAWALARYTGHAGSGTLLKSYFHLFDLWHEERVPVFDEERLPKDTEGVVVLDQLPRLASIDVSLLDDGRATNDRTRIEQMIRFMHLIARRTAVADAASATGLAFEFADFLNGELVALSSRLWLSATATRGGKDRKEKLAFLRRITDGGWDRLLKLAARLDEREPIGAEAGQSLPLAAAEVKHLVGATRQLVMWKEAHFSSIRAFIDAMELDQERYAIAVSKQCEDNGRIVGLARKYGFLGDASDLENARAVARARQLDSATDIENDNRVEKRCCLLLSEAGVGDKPRNRIELIALFVAHATAVGYTGAAKRGAPI